MHDKTIEHGYYTFEIKWEYDEDWADLSHLGKPTDKRGEYMVDRKTGQLLGEYVDEVITLPYNKIRGRKMVDDSYAPYGKWPSSETWDKAEELIKQRVEALPYQVDMGDDTYSVQWDAHEKEFWAEVSGYKILADNLGSTFGWHEYRYFDVEVNHLPHNPANWKNISLESMKGESFEAADIHYAVEDWKRWEAYNNNYWSMMGCIATVYKDGIEIAESSCWGIESDGGEEYHAEMEESVLSEALHQAELSLNAKELLKEANYA